MKNTKARLDKSQTHYKNNCEAILRKQSEIIRKHEEVYFRFEQKSPNGHTHKLEPVPEGLFKLTKACGNTIAIKKTNRSIQNVSRSRVILPPKPQT